MKAMILAAGLGTRLRPLTNHIPKALIEIHGIPILEIIITKLKASGFRDIVINLHYLPDKVKEFISNKKSFGIDIHLIEEIPEILDTGGGIKNAASYLNGSEPFLIHNVDVLSDINLNEMMNYHVKKNALATVAIKGKKSDRSLLFNDKLELAGWENRSSGKRKLIEGMENQNLTSIGFCGLHVIDPIIFDLMPADKKFSIIEAYLALAKNHRISGFPAHDNFWMDIGSHEQLKVANKVDPDRYCL